MATDQPPAERQLNFIEQIIEEDNRGSKFNGRVQTRCPPEPNGYLHIGHAKSICLNFMLAERYGGQCNLRFDDTNPTKEEDEYVKAIQEDVRWLGFDWEDRLFFASDYFQQLYEWAVQLIKKGKAYVCDLDAEQMRQHRGTLTQPGTDSPHRDRSVEENLALFDRMRAGGQTEVVVCIAHEVVRAVKVHELGVDAIGADAARVVRRAFDAGVGHAC